MLHQDIAALTQQALHRVQTGNLPEAKALYGQICQLNKEDAEAWMMLGAVNGELGNTAEAVSCLETAIELRPDFPQAHYNLGNVLRLQGRHQDALTCLERAVQLEPAYAEAWQVLGGVNMLLGKMEEAQACCQRVLSLRPNSADAHVKLGIVFIHSGRNKEAAESFRKATELEPGSVQYWHMLFRMHERVGVHSDAEMDARRALRIKADFYEAHLVLGNSLRAQNRLDEAIESYRAALKLNPDSADVHFSSADVHFGLGSVLMERGNPDAAASEFRRAVELNPNHSSAFNSLGLALHEIQDHAGAIAAFQKALAIKPESPGTHSNLGIVYHALGNLKDAELCYRESVRLQPDSPGTWNNLAATLSAQVKFEDAIVAYRRALELQPDFDDVRSNMLLCMNYTTSYDPGTIFAEHRAWEAAHVSCAPRIQSYGNLPDSARRIRIGYVSPDLRAHSVAFFIEPVLKNHNPVAFEVVCYADVRKADDVTQRLRGYVHGWRNICGMSVASVIKAIQDDGIDILVDLAGHTGYNRLGVFACKPAPVQVSYLGYPNTTGLSTVDYRLTDAWADPPGSTDKFYTETLLRLPRGFLCYMPDPAAPAVESTPALQAGHVTFGSFNILTKMAPAVVALWSSILRAVPGSRLMLKNNSMTDNATRDRVYVQFAAHGITRDRIDLSNRQPTLAEHLSLYHRVDIALDPFPYNGATTTCEALWMGVPVITLAGHAHAGRVGVSILSQIGLSECIAATQDEYLAIATRLANNLEGLKQLRSELRGRMIRSPLCDAAGFTRRLEDAYRKMWGEWCAVAGKQDS